MVLSLIPVIAGSLRLLEIAGGQQLLPTNPRIDASPAPVVAYVLAAALYALARDFSLQDGWPSSNSPSENSPSDSNAVQFG